MTAEDQTPTPEAAAPTAETTTQAAPEATPEAAPLPSDAPAEAATAGGSFAEAAPAPDAGPGPGPEAAGDAPAGSGAEEGAEPRAAEGADEHGADGDAADSEGDGDEAAGEESAGEGGAAAEGGEVKKRRRRRRKRGGTGTTSPGTAEAASGGAPEHPQPKGGGGVFARYVEAAAGRASGFEVGVAVAGRAVRVAPDVVFLDLFGKTDAFMPGAEAHDAEGTSLHRPGEMIKNVRVVSVAEDGRLVVSGKPVDEAAAVAHVEARAAASETVEGIVYGLNRGGFDVWLGGVRAFCPASQMALRPIDDPEPFVGRSFTFVITDLKPGAKDVVVSRRSILQREADETAARVRATLVPGTVVKGRVTQVKDFGAFLDLGGVEGFVHVSELSWERVERSQDVLRHGEEVEAVVLKVPPPRPQEGKERKERGTRIPLSLKALRDDPWKQVAQRIRVGEKRSGKVVRTAEFGAFVELEPGIDGLLHVSELGRNLKHAKDAVAEGTLIDVLIERVDPDSRRISLSKWSETAGSAAADGTVIDPRSIRMGATVEAKVERIEPTGLQVQIVGVVGKRGRGQVASADTGTPKGTDLRKQFPAGATLKVKVVGFERDGRVKLSRKALLRDEEREAFHSYRSEVSKKSFGTFGDLLRKAQISTPEQEPEAEPDAEDVADSAEAADAEMAQAAVAEPSGAPVEANAPEAELPSDAAGPGTDGEDAPEPEAARSEPPPGAVPEAAAVEPPSPADPS